MSSQLKSKYPSILLATLFSTLAFSVICYADIYGYIPNSGSNDFSVINTNDHSLSYNGPLLDSEPFGVATSPDGNYIYVTNKTSGHVSQINSLTDTVDWRHYVGGEPVGVAVSPDGTEVYVANQDGNLHVLNTIAYNAAPVDLSTITSPTLYGVAVHPEGKFIYVTDDNNNQVHAIRHSDYTDITSLGVFNAPRGVAVDQFGNYLVVVNSGGTGTVSKITLADNVVTSIDVGSNPFGVAITHDGRHAYVTNTDDDTLSKIDLLLGTVSPIKLYDPAFNAPPVPVDGPKGISVSPYGDSLYVANTLSDSVKVVSTTDDKLDSYNSPVLVGDAPVAFGNFFFPEAPTGLSVTLVGDTGMDLSWTDNAMNETGFIIERRKYTTGGFYEIDRVGADVTTYSDRNLDYYANFYYQVKAYNDEGSTIYSNIEFDQTVKEDINNCFIATAAYGSYWEPQVMTLRNFRDSFLLTNKLGNIFVKAYYEYSPPLAKYIAKHEILKSAVRIGLSPLIGFSWLALNFGISVPFILSVCLAISLFLAVRLLFNHRKTLC